MPPSGKQLNTVLSKKQTNNQTKKPCNNQNLLFENSASYFLYNVLKTFYWLEPFVRKRVHLRVTRGTFIMFCFTLMFDAQLRYFSCNTNGNQKNADC